MYFEERIINGIYYYRTTPAGDFKPCDTNTQIAKLRAQVERLEEKLKNAEAPPPVKQWEPKAGTFILVQRDRYCTVESAWHDVRNLSQAGRTYTTMEQAEKAASCLARYNYLLAYILEHTPDWEPGGGENGQHMYYVFINENGKAQTGYSPLRSVGHLTMSEACANRLVADINAGRMKKTLGI